MTEPVCFREVIELWPPREALAAELGLSSRRVSKWWQRRSIPAENWSAILRTERARSGGVTADLLTRFASRELCELRP